MNAANIFSKIKDSFCALWSYKVRGNTIEIIIPFSTPTSKFISVFVTQRDDKFIVTDGGWLMSGEYIAESFLQKIHFKNLLGYFEVFYDLKRTSQLNNEYFYKTTVDEIFVPNLVYDISQFVSQILSALNAQIDYDDAELNEKELFTHLTHGLLIRVRLCGHRRC